MALTTAVSTSKRQIATSLERWQGSLDREDLPLFRDFVEETVSRLRAPFLAQHPPNEVLTYLEEAFQFARQRPPDGVKLEIRPRPSKGVAVFSCMNDQPFLVDTIRLFLKSQGSESFGGFNLVFGATRDESGRLIAVGDDQATLESLVMLEADAGRVLPDVEGATAALLDNIALARAMVRDFRAMKRSVERLAEKCETLADRRPDRADDLRETAAFLKWLQRENFVFMGLEDGEPLGIQAIESRYHGSPEGEWPPPHAPGSVQVRKSHIESPVHRAGRIDELLVTIEEDGSQETLFIRGMFTYRAVTQPSRNVPILRRVLANILEEQRSVPGSFRYKGIANVFDSLPTEFLFTATRQAIAEMVDLVFEAEQQQEVGVTFLMTGQDTAFYLVAMPKTQFSDDLRRELQDEIVGALNASYCDHGLFVGRYDTVLLHYFLTGISFPGDQRVKHLTERVRQLATPWLARLWHALVDRYGEEEADRLADTYGRAFPEPWIRNTSAERAVRDIEMLEALSGDRPVLGDVFEDGEDLVLRLYETRDVNLTDILPVLDHFGLTVIDSYATVVNSRGGRLHMDTFRLAGAEGVSRQDLLARAPLLVAGLEAVYGGAVEDDPLNALVLTSGLSWQEVDVIRGFAHYGRQLQIKLSEPRVREILLTHPVTCACLVRLFHARFDPDLTSDRAAAIQAAEEAVHDELRLITSHDEDLVFSALLTLIRATVRTNYYRTDRNPYYVSFKVDGSKVKAMGRNAPAWEIYVHNKDVEGVHLRYGKVARGGLRWSDRDDFRTEVHNLATTQLIKNVVIVPSGAKGGFYLKSPSRDPRTRRQEADRHYQTFIRGLLDVTDNSVGGQIVPPPRVVRHDPDDPYLVVAADKGTAHLSDTANKISLSYGFWLGDAFASGGSNGYDHKKVGITARGAWKLVRRHFAEMGIDPFSQPFTAAGIGDMSGDVFGNGMTQTPFAKLKAAFNHLHIFLDPDPDPARSYEERVRLFKAMGGWDQYDRALISEGGGVFDRRAKSVPLSPQAQEMLGLFRDEAEPELVIRHILMMDVDLLWNGGIGTYVKASTESHADADDRSNNAVRVDGSQLRARIIGEGGNLGFTQKGRIEAGLLGVRLNADAIDNSGGVDMSDHEVNLKILLGRIVERGDMTLEERNVLLEEMTEEVAELVFASNDAHGRQLSRDQIRSRMDIFQFGRAIDFVEREFGRDRASLSLPSDAELKRRAELGEGLTRPELAMLSAWVKMYVYDQLLKDDPKQIPGYEALLMSYFPKAIQERFPEDIRNHMLADEIVATVATTRMVADAGAAFVPMTIETTAATVLDITTAYLKAQTLAHADEVRGTLEELRTDVSLSGLYRAWVMVDAGAREVARYWLSTSGRIPTEDELEDMRKAVDEVYELQASDVIARNRSIEDELRADNIPEDVAQHILKAQYLNMALTIWSEAKRTGSSFTDLVVRHLAIARASRLQEVLDDLGSRPATGRWDPIALRILQNRFHSLLSNLVASLPINGAIASVDALEPRLAEGPLKDVRAQVDNLLSAEEVPDVATLLVLEERVTSAIQRIS